jgi:hypothetical protein
MPLCICLVSVINYRVDVRYIRCYWGPVPIRKFEVDDVRNAVRGYQHMSESWTNTIWMPSIRNRGVVLHRRTGGFKRVILTPDDPDEFIALIKGHPRYRGEGQENRTPGWP